MSEQHTERSLTLHHHPGSRSDRPHWLLNEIGTPYTLALVNLRKGEQRSEGYAAIHPLGKVPALEIDGQIIVESLAICLYLADAFPDAQLAPPPDAGIARTTYYSWMCFSTGTLEPSALEESRKWKYERRDLHYIAPGPAFTPFERVRDHLESHLGQNAYILGGQFSAADILNAAVMMPMSEKGILDGFPNIKAWLDRLRARPAFQKTFDD